MRPLLVACLSVCLSPPPSSGSFDTRSIVFFSVLCHKIEKKARKGKKKTGKCSLFLGRSSLLVGPVTTSFYFSTEKPSAKCQKFFLGVLKMCVSEKWKINKSFHMFLLTSPLKDLRKSFDREAAIFSLKSCLHINISRPILSHSTEKNSSLQSVQTDFCQGPSRQALVGRWREKI